MKVVTDAAANLSPERAAELDVDVIPFQVGFMGKTYRDGIDIPPARLYQMYSENPKEYPITSQPSVGDFTTTYEKYPEEEILSIHLSSGLSGAFSSAVHAARMVASDRLTVIDSKTVGPALGWMVEVAARGAQLGWSKERIIAAMNRVKENTLTMVSFSDMKYLLHSGRVTHLRGLMASILKIKPIIGMNDEDGRYSNLGQELTMTRLLRKMTSIVTERFGSQKLRLQLMHGDNLPGVEQLRAALSGVVESFEEKLTTVTLVLGAHAGPTVIGLAAMPLSISEATLEA